MADNPQEVKLLPCRWCGEAQSPPDHRVSSDGEVEWYRCGKCGFEGGLAYSKSEAGDLWNTRATPDQMAGDKRDVLRPIDMQDVRLAAGEGKLSAADVLAGCNAELRRRLDHLPDQMAGVDGEVTQADQQFCATYLGYQPTPDEDEAWGLVQAFARHRRAAVAVERERCASAFEAAIADGYDTPAWKVDQCAHGKFGWEDCIACYDEHLTRAVTSIRQEPHP